MSEQQKSLPTIFVEALEIDDVQQRAAFLAQGCGADSALRREVEELIQAHATAGKFLPQQPAVTGVREALLSRAQALGPAGAASIVPVSERPGDRIGRYKLLQQIGEGGCGIVYTAEQEEPVRRRVALKVIKLGMDTKQVVARFEAERQALALMDHPNIAKVFDAGATETGRPYFVMELVRGTKITEYCDENELSTRERLELFIQVCLAVQHAHQKGIIHRDLKPSNILVTVNDAKPVPKVIDFGIAKATEGRLTDHTLFTAFDQFLGTPAYMSPEQTVMTSQDIDTRSDLYSLGVLLYELLTGKTPFDTKELLAAGLDELRRTIREKEPMRPSTRLKSMLQQELTTTAKHRRSEAPKLIHLLRGDLDWIAMRCLEKDRARRYETADGLATDIERHLNNEPVVARPQSNLYRIQKLVRRHALAFAAGAALTGVLAIAAAEVLYQTNRGRRIATQSLVRLHVTNGTRLMNEGDLFGSLLSFTEALRLDTFSPTREESHRIRIASVLRQCPKLVGVFTHEAGINGALFSPDDHHLLTGSDDRTAKVWDLLSGKKLFELKHDGPVYSAAFSPDNQVILTISSTHQPHLWNAATGEPLLRPSIRHLGRWTKSQPRFSPDGDRLLTLPQLNVAQIWDVSNGQTIGPPLHHDRELSFFDFSPNGRLIVTIADDDLVRVWDAFTGELRLSLSHPRAVSHAAFSPDSRWLVTASDDGQVRFWDSSSGRFLPPALEHRNGVEAVFYNPDGDRLVTKSWDKSVQVWDVLTRKPLISPINHELQVFNAIFNPDGRRVVTISGGNLLRLWDAETGKLLGPTLRNAFWRDPVVFSSDGRMIAAVLRQEARVWDLGTSESPPLAIRPVAFFKESTFSSNGRLKAKIGGDNIVRILDLSAEESRAQPIQQLAPIKQVAFGSDDDILITESADSSARIWDLATGDVLTPLLQTRYALDAPLISKHDLPRDDRPAVDLVMLAELLSGNRIDETGGFCPLDVGESIARWTSLRSKYPASLSTSPQETFTWHEQEATACEQAWSWWSAIFHLDRVIAARPQDQSLRNRRAYAQICLEHSRTGAVGHLQMSHLIPPRDPLADGSTVDLTSHYNRSLKYLSPAMSCGLQVVGGTTFDLRGTIRLRGLEDKMGGSDYPEQATGIKIGRKCRNLHFLHAAKSQTMDGSLVGSYLVHYANNEAQTFPIVYGKDVRDWVTAKDEPLNARNSQLLWIGPSPLVQSWSRSLRIFKSTWVNPLPNEELASIDFISAMSSASPFLVALTAE